MKKIMLNVFVLLVSAPIVAVTAIVGGLISGLYYLLFYVYTKFILVGEKVRVSNKISYRN